MDLIYLNKYRTPRGVGVLLWVRDDRTGEKFRAKHKGDIIIHTEDLTDTFECMIYISDLLDCSFYSVRSINPAPPVKPVFANQYKPKANVEVIKNLLPKDKIIADINDWDDEKIEKLSINDIKETLTRYEAARKQLFQELGIKPYY